MQVRYAVEADKEAYARASVLSCMHIHNVPPCKNERGMNSDPYAFDLLVNMKGGERSIFPQLNGYGTSTSHQSITRD